MEKAPEEACGILVCEGIGAYRVVQLANRAHDRMGGYSIDPHTLSQLSLAPDTWNHVVVWHTHPGGMVGPSPLDLQHKIAGIRYLVVTIPTGEARFF